MGKKVRKLELRCASWEEFSQVYEEQLSKDKVIVPLDKPLKKKSSVRIKLTLPSKTTVHFSGACEDILKDSKSQDKAVLRINEISLESMLIIENAIRALHSDKGKQVIDPTEFDTSLDMLATKNFEELNLATEELISALFTELSAMSKLDPFKILECSYAPSDEDVQYSFSRLAKRYHPDKFVKYNVDEVKFLSEEIFLLIRDAYEALYTEAKREAIRLGMDIDFSKIESELPFEFFDDSESLFDDLGDFGSDGESDIFGSGGESDVFGASGKLSDFETKDDFGDFDEITQVEALNPIENELNEDEDEDEETAFANKIEDLVDTNNIVEALRLLEKSEFTETNIKCKVLHHICLAHIAMAEKNKLEAAEQLEMAQEKDPKNARVNQAMASVSRKIVEERQSHLDDLMTKLDEE